MRMEPIAIVGMTGRFPGAETLEHYWDNLRNGVESITFFNDAELSAAGVDPELVRNPRFVRARGVMPGADLFDAVFFGINPHEAQLMDPQQRVFLEEAWAALERAGYPPGDKPALNVGIFAGASLNTYLIENAIGNLNALMAAGGFQMLLTNDKDFLATRASYKLNLRGPGVTIQTACSTSLVAVQLACQSLIARQCDMALAGGVSVLAPRVSGYLYEAGMILSPDGHCRAFDINARGTVVGEGVGIVVLKRLEDALADRDHVHAVIRGAALNNDGSLKVGYTAPSVDGQTEAIAMAHALADIDPATITLVEAHGTGTELGDPIEVAALTQAFRRHTDRRGFCALGSVKTNLGHLDAAAGVAGLIKAVLALEHREIPPSLHFTQPNPLIDFAASPFFVNAALRAWEKGETPRRAAVSSFGIGGTNAHVVIEEAPAEPVTSGSRPVQALTLSAKTEAALERTTSNLGTYLTRHPDVDLADVAFTLHRGRSTFSHRRVIIAASAAEASRALEQKDARSIVTSVESRHERPVVFMFSGQGSQYVGMGRGLYETEPVFRDCVDACCESLREILGFDLRDVLYPAPAKLDAAKARLATTAVTQPALFVVEYALASLLMNWGIRPRAMLGHSVGEYVAACLAAVFRPDDALKLVAARGRLMEVPGGAMLAVSLPERELVSRLPGDLSIAAVNGPAMCAVSGRATSIEEFSASLRRRGVEGLRIHAAAAFHSAMMDPILSAFTEAVRGVPVAAPAIPYVSNVTGTWATATEVAEPSYWARHLRHTVRFWDGLQEITREGEPVLLEVGPGHTLASLARHASTAKRALQILSSLRHPNDQQTDAVTLQTTVGRLWLGGVPVDWAAYHAGETRRRVPLPTYPFERKRHWIEPTPTPSQPVARLQQLRKRPEIAEWFYAPSWRRAPRRAPGAPISSGPWLLFADDCGVADALAERLEELGAPATVVVKGNEFTRLPKGRFAIVPDVREHFNRLITELKTSGAYPRRVLHLWSLTPAAEASSRAYRANGDPEHEFHSMLYLAQALAEHGMREDVSLGVVVNGLYDVTGEAVFGAHRGTVVGPAIALPQELPHVSCRVIDVILPGGAREMTELAEQLLQELGEPFEAHVVAYRRRYRWLQGWESVRLPSAPRPGSLRDNGVYLITGGLGGIGLVLARYLAERVRARLVLVGRTALPPREQWTSWLDGHDANDATAVRIRALRALEEAGAEVLAFGADVTDEARMARVLAESRRRFGAVNGVIHAAGILELGIMQLKTREGAERVLRPKVRGTTVLWELVKEDEPDFFFLCSSISTVVAGPGLADYRGANASLDAFAHSQMTAGNGRTRVISAKFDAWQEIGMAVALGEADKLPDAIHPTEGVDVFERVLASDLTEVVVSTRELPLLITLARAETAAIHQAQEAEASSPAADAAIGSRTGLSTAFVAPGTEMERAVAGIWQKLLGIERLGTQDDFFEAGGHSLLATQVMSRLFRRYGVDVPLRMIFEATTLGAFAERVEEIVRAAEAGREEIEL
jgi:acyl transferase domain-containing protein